MTVRKTETERGRLALSSPATVGAVHFVERSLSTSAPVALARRSQNSPCSSPV